MKVELFKGEQDTLELLDTFFLKDVKQQLELEVSSLKADQEKAKKKKEKEKAKKDKEGNSTKDGDEDKPDEPEDDKKASELEEELAPIPTPKLKVSIEFTRSGFMQVTKAMAGSYRVEVEHQRKAS